MPRGHGGSSDAGNESITVILTPELSGVVKAYAEYLQTTPEELCLVALDCFVRSIDTRKIRRELDDLEAERRKLSGLTVIEGGAGKIPDEDNS
jgi:hypothetical protein